MQIKQSTIKGAGRGVFATHEIKKGEVIEVCPVLVMPRHEYKTIKATSLRNYYFMWGTVTCAICFGYGSLYNHSYDANATYVKNIKQMTITFIALKTIAVGEEITVNYNYGQPSQKKLWISEIAAAEDKS